MHSGFKAILCAKNVTRDKWNQIVSDMLEAENPSEAGRLYTAYQEISLEGGEDADESQLHRELTPEDMSEIGDADSAAPKASLMLRVGDVCLLAKNIDKVAGLVKNRRVEVCALRWNSIRIKLLREDAPDTFHVIARCRFSITKKGRAVGIMRKQLPLTKAWALSINKSQGQTLDRLLLDCTVPPFEHGHSYGAIRSTQFALDRALVSCASPVHHVIHPVPPSSRSRTLARPRPLFLRRVRRQQVLLQARQWTEVPRVAVHHVRRVVGPRARVSEVASGRSRCIRYMCTV